MDEFKIYIIGIIITVAIFAVILKKVFSELERHGDFVENESANFSKDELAMLSGDIDEKCLKLCESLEALFIKYKQKMPEQKTAEALLSVLDGIKSLPSNQLQSRLAALLAEFENCVKNELGEDEAGEFFSEAGKLYNDIFKD